MLIPHVPDTGVVDGPPAVDDAIASAEATAEHYRGVLAGGTGVPSPEVHHAIRDVARFLDDHDHPDPAVDLLVALARPLRAAGDPRRAGVLHDLAIALAHRGEVDEAAGVLTESVAAYRVAIRGHGGDDIELANALYLLAMVNAGRGVDLHEALAAGEEAAERFREVRRREPEAGVTAAAEVAALDVVQLLLLLVGRDADAAAVARRRAELE